VSAGFFPVDVAVTLARPPVAAAPAGAPACDLAPAGPEHRDGVLAIAAAAIRGSRFHLDPLLPDGLADRIKRAWSDNCLRGLRGVGMTVALSDGAVAGFLAAGETRRDGLRARVIDLIAVHPDRQGRGIGRTLVDAFVREHGPHADLLLVGTQAANIRSLRLYEEQGFRVAETRFVLHFHAGR
jgi:ribosomal protein S18 acetylase RimI-like enzyme